MNHIELQISLLTHRIAMLMERGETMNHGIIAKCKRQIRKYQGQL